MKLQQTYLKQKTFRFKRWSRKGYAAFFSLGRAVTIGQLSSNVAERFQVKNGSNHSSVLLTGQIGPEEAKKETELLQEQSCAEAIQTVKQTSAAGSFAYIIICIYPKAGSFSYAETSRFSIS